MIDPVQRQTAVVRKLSVFCRVVILLTTLTIAGPVQLAYAQTSTPPSGPPAGFSLIDSAPGVELYRKNYANGNPDFVQVINLDQGARLEFLHGQITEQRPDKGSYGGPDPRMTSPAIQTYWQNAVQEDQNAFCVVNGSFFYMPEYPTRLAFPLKADGTLISDGWGIDTYADQKLILELWKDHADIEQLTADSLKTSTAPDILGGLTEDANKRMKYSVGRTFVGLGDRDHDGAFETIMIFSTGTALQSGAAQVLRDFGADKVMMLDGGGSTQLLCKSGHYIRSDRPIPQALAVFAAAPQAVAAELVQPPKWQILDKGDRLPFQIEIRNTGTMSWTLQDARFFLDPTPLGVAKWLPVNSEVKPGATTVLTDTLPSVNQTGVQLFQISWGVRTGGKAYQGAPVSIMAVVLPTELTGQRPALEAQLQNWQNLPVDQVKKLVEDWMDKQAPNQAPTQAPTIQSTYTQDLPAGQIRPEDVFFIPLLMLPIMLILAVIIGKRNPSPRDYN